jgi:hypothetical protein
MKLIGIVGIILIFIACQKPISSFEECVAQGNPVLESYPRQCTADGKTFVEPLIGGDTDEHGCLIAAGYQWCPSQDKCMRMWEEYCEEYKDMYRGENPE